MKTVQISLDFFPGYNTNPPCFVASYRHPDTNKEVVSIASEVCDGQTASALTEAYEYAEQIQFELFTEGFASEVKEIT
jgi:hypothetical protein